MKNFKVEVSKWLERYNLIKKAESESLLRDELHREGFSILTITEIGDIDVTWNKFFFEILEKNWTIKIWTIVSNDIFKAYLKIKYELKYDLKYIYIDKDTSTEEKEKIIKELEIHYNLYLEANKKQLNKKQLENDDRFKVIKEESTDSFQMKKELDYIYKIIDRVLFKLRNVLELNDNEYIDFQKKELLKNIYNEIIKLKNSTNIPKLKQIWELALNKIWEIELSILENKKNEEYKNLLSETNKLLREVWSKKSFIEKDKDLVYIFNKLLKEVFLYIKSNKKEKRKKIEIDTTSTAYLKNKHLLNKYESRLKQLEKEKRQNFLIYFIPNKSNLEKKLEYIIKEKVIRQNLIILKWRISWGIFSYIKLIKWYNYFIERLLNFVKFFEFPILLILIVYTVIFLSINLFNSFWVTDINLNFNWMFYFIYFNILLILIKLTKWIFSLGFNIVFFIFLFIFWVINF